MIGVRGPLHLLRGAVARAADGLFAPAPATRLAGSRIVLGAYTLCYMIPRRRLFAKVHRTDPALFAPVGPVRALRRPLPPRVADALFDAETAAGTAFTVGLLHRVTGPVHAALLLWTISYRNSWSLIPHSDNLTVLHTGIAAASPAADAWSIDAVVRRRRGLAAPTPHWRYGYPLHVASAVTTVVYWLSGMAKIKGPMGWRWATGNSLRGQVAADGLRKEVLGSSASPIGVAVYNRPFPWTAMAVASLALELGAPIALANRKVGWAWAVGAFGLHWGIKAIMDITFRYQLSGAAYASFVPWDRVVTRLRGALGRTAVR